MERAFLLRCFVVIVQIEVQYISTPIYHCAGVVMTLGSMDYARMPIQLCLLYLLVLPWLKLTCPAIYVSLLCPTFSPC